LYVEIVVEEIGYRDIAAIRVREANPETTQKVATQFTRNVFEFSFGTNELHLTCISLCIKCTGAPTYGIVPIKSI